MLRVIWFCIAAIFGGLLIVYLGPTETVSISVFAIAVLASSIVVSIRQSFDSYAVDLVYYSAAIIAVLIFFLSGEPDRVRFAVDDAINTLENDKDSVVRERAAFDLMRSDTRQAQNMITRAVTARIKKSIATEQILYAMSAADCSDAQSRHMSGQIGYSEVQSRCNVKDSSMQRIVGLTVELKEVSTFPGARRWIENNQRLLLDIGGYQIAAGQTLTWIGMDKDAEEQLRKRYNGQESDIQSQISSKREELKGLDDSVLTGKALEARRLALLYWPYIAIALLGLKIGKVSYTGLRRGAGT